MIHTLPSYGFRRANIKNKSGVSQSPDSFTLSKQTYDYGGERLEVVITLPRLHKEELGKEWKAFFARVREDEMFYFHNQLNIEPPYLPTAFTAPTLVNTHAGADKILATTGWVDGTYTDDDGNPRIKAGDYLSITSNVNNEPCLFMLTETPVIENGNANLRIFPGVRTELLRDSQVDFRNPRGLFIMFQIPDMVLLQDDHYQETTFSAYQVQ